ncbi:conserved hypothetical protein [Verticillium alfalfae VaMs.102]|uniref:Acyclic terpene utilisation N-terminal domain-containing protein n=1 Tax=Verticillium alfalfae (strain VaMs.102 / ATCC MYA-4576 / FGSC 10136) TaxID=526221 RepID=C9SDE6_VERA1|nr:conserved hypothetical protein [Verticillium alfalfae VaMs.102]EEY17098.1 conserved hypothetical protein [Verticillium alfalfae VaMs.102]
MAPSATNNGHRETNGHVAKRPINIAGCSGGQSRLSEVRCEKPALTPSGVYDRKRAIHDMAKNEDVDVITGDWMSECNMTLRGSDKRDRLAQKKMSSGSTVVAKGYEPYFLDELDPAIPHLASRGIKIAVNAGASDVHGLALAVKELIMKHGVDLKVGVVDGDDVTDAVLDLYQKDPIAAIDEKGEAIITMEKGKHGLVNTQTVASQLLYEIQGPLYYNSDVTASIEDMYLQEIGENAVHVSGVKGLPPPSTTKGRSHCDMRIFAQTRDPDLLSGNNFVDSDRGSFARFCIENLLQGYPGSTMAPDMRTAIGRPFFEYWVSLLPQKFVNETVHLPDGRVLDIPSPVVTREYAREQPSYETESPANLEDFGPTTRGPIGWVAMGRSGDKSSNCNMGLFVRHDDEWNWLRTIMTTKQLRRMAADFFKTQCPRPFIMLESSAQATTTEIPKTIIMYSAIIFGIAAAVFVAPESTLASLTSGDQIARVQLGPSDLRHLNTVARARILRVSTAGLAADLQDVDQDYPTRMVQQRETRNLIRGIDMERIANNMEALVTFQNRYYQSEHGVAASEWIYQEIKRSQKGEARRERLSLSELISMQATSLSQRASGIQQELPVQNRVVFQFYAAGDAGLKGSLDIFQQYKNQNISVAAMLNQDMAGSFLSEQSLPDYFNIVSTGTYDPLNGFLKRVIRECLYTEPMEGL